MGECCGQAGQQQIEEAVEFGGAVVAGQGGCQCTQDGEFGDRQPVQTEPEYVVGLCLGRLSEALGRDGVLLYRHVRSLAAVLDGVAEIVLAQLAVNTADPDWAAQLRTVAHAFRQLALAHPNVVPLLVTRPLATPLGQRPPGMLRPL